jgi:hypothetical protein
MLLVGLCGMHLGRNARLSFFVCHPGIECTIQLQLTLCLFGSSGSQRHGPGAVVAHSGSSGHLVGGLSSPFQLQFAALPDASAHGERHQVCRRPALLITTILRLVFGGGSICAQLGCFSRTASVFLQS